MSSPPKYLFQYEDMLMNWDYNLNQAKVKIFLNEYRVIRETPCGYWISKYSDALIHIDNNLYPEQRWVSKTSKKRFAYPTKHEALLNLKYRKQRQIKILERNLARAKSSLDLCLKELDFNRKEYYEKKNKT